MALPYDDLVPEPSLIWNHAVTIHAPPSQIYPWLIQIGDSRAAFYSITFIENAFCATSGECRYVNANKIHPEWQNPEKGKQGIIMDYMVIHDYQKDQYVLAVQSEKLPLKWTWLWYLNPLGNQTTKLIVRHRVSFPPDTPKSLIDSIFTTGFVMEKAMLNGIKSRAEGNIPWEGEEALGALVWLLTFGIGILCATRFIHPQNDFRYLTIGILVIGTLFVLTYIQPTMLWRVLLVLLITISFVICEKPGLLSKTLAGINKNNRS